MSCHLCCVHLSVHAPPRVGWHVDAGSGEFNLWMGATCGSTFNFLHVAKNKTEMQHATKMEDYQQK